MKSILKIKVHPVVFIAVCFIGAITVSYVYFVYRLPPDKQIRKIVEIEKHLEKKHERENETLLDSNISNNNGKQTLANEISDLGSILEELTILKDVISRYYKDNLGKMPASLKDLVPEYISQINYDWDYNSQTGLISSKSELHIDKENECTEMKENEEFNRHFFYMDLDIATKLYKESNINSDILNRFANTKIVTRARNYEYIENYTPNYTINDFEITERSETGIKITNQKLNLSLYSNSRSNPTSLSLGRMFFLSPNEKYLVVKDGHNLIFYDFEQKQELNIVRLNLTAADANSHMWSDDYSKYWICLDYPPFDCKYIKIDPKNWEITEFSSEYYEEQAFNPNNGKLIFSDMIRRDLFIEDMYDKWAKKGSNASLFVIDLETDKKTKIFSSFFNHYSHYFRPKWINDNTIEYFDIDKNEKVVYLLE